jgi:phosphinothricin acetyltransferase
MEADAERIAEIYAPYVLSTPVSFEIIPPTAEEMRLRIRQTLSIATWLVYEIDGEIAGFAYGTRHRPREAFRWSADVAIYLDERFHKRGVGQALYSQLIRMLTEMGYYNVYAGIVMSNPASIKFHENFGFKLVSVYRSIGFKLGQWHDLGWWHLKLREPVGVPEEIRPFQS